MFRDWGLGVGLRPAHYASFLDGHAKSVAWVEVISENFLPRSGEPWGRPFQKLKKVRENYPVALHGVSMSLASVDALDPAYLKRLKALVDAVDPIVVSDHVCWTGVDGENLHDLFPVPYSEEVLDWVSEKILRAQDFLGRRILVENVSSYVEFESSEMTEWDFVAELARRADCGLLLDVNNIFVSATNHEFSASEYLRAMPAERVGQIHLAGHSERDGYLIDTHDAPVREEVWSLYREALRHVGPVSTMIERDGNIPEWEELEQEVLHAGRIRDEVIGKGQAASGFACREPATL